MKTFKPISEQYPKLRIDKEIMLLFLHPEFFDGDGEGGNGEECVCFVPKFQEFLFARRLSDKELRSITGKYDKWAKRKFMRYENYIKPRMFEEFALLSRMEQLIIAGRSFIMVNSYRKLKNYVSIYIWFKDVSRINYNVFIACQPRCLLFNTGVRYRGHVKFLGAEYLLRTKSCERLFRLCWVEGRKMEHSEL